MRKSIVKCISLLGMSLMLSNCGTGSTASSNTSSTPSDVVLSINAPSQYPAGQLLPLVAVLTITNSSTSNATNLIYSVPSSTNYTGVAITIDPTGVSGNNCTNIPAGSSCSFTATIGANANPGGFTVLAMTDTSANSTTKSDASKVTTTQTISVKANLGLVDIPINTYQFYILPSTQTLNSNEGVPTTVMVSVLVQNSAQTFDDIILVNNNGTPLDAVLVGALSTNIGGVNTYAVSIPSGTAVQRIQAFSSLDGVSVCSTTNPNINACSNDATINLSAGSTGILSIQPNYFNMTPTYQTQVITLTNTGNGNVTNIQAPEVNAPFSISNNTCTSALAASASCTLVVTYTPDTNSGVASMLVSYNNGNISTSTSITVPYVGMSPTPTAIVTADPTSVMLSESNVGQVIRLTNSGTESATNLILPTLPSELQLRRTNCGTTLAIGASCLYSISYSGPTSTSGAATLSFNYNNGQSEQTLNIPTVWEAYEPTPPLTSKLLSGWSNGTVFLDKNVVAGSGVGGLDGAAVQAVVQSGSAIYAATAANVWTSVLGDTWSLVGESSVGIGQIQSMAVFESTVYVAFRDQSNLRTIFAVYSSTNNGAWVKLPGSENGGIFTVGNLYSLAVDSQGTLYAGASADLVSGKVYKFNGTQWSQLGSDLGFPARVIAFDSNNTLFAAGSRVLAPARNGVAVYSEASLNWIPLALSIDTGDNSTIKDMTVTASRQFGPSSSDVYILLNTGSTQTPSTHVYTVTWHDSNWNNPTVVGSPLVGLDYAITNKSDTLYVCGTSVYQYDIDTMGSWVQMPGGGVLGALFSYAIPDSSGAIVSAACQNSGTLSASLTNRLIAGLNGSQLFTTQISSDGIPTVWSQIGSPAVTSNALVTAVGGQDRNIYAAVTNNYFGQTVTALVYKFIRAKNWQSLAVGPWGNTDLISSMIVSGSKVYVATRTSSNIYSGVYFYDGNGWVNTNLEVPKGTTTTASNYITQLITDNSNNVYAASTNGYVSMYNGESWSSMGESSLNTLLVNNKLYTLAVDNSGALYASGTGAVIYKLPARLSTWVPVARPATDFTYFSSVSSSPRITNLVASESGDMYAAVVSTQTTNQSCGVYKLTQGESTWSMLSPESDVPSFSTCINIPGLVVDNTTNTIYSGMNTSGNFGSGILTYDTMNTMWDYVSPLNYARLVNTTAGYNPPMFILYMNNLSQ